LIRLEFTSDSVVQSHLLIFTGETRSMSFTPEILGHIPTPTPFHKSIDLESGNSSFMNQKALHWWDSFSKGIIGISTFGASICFSVIMTELPDPVPIRQASPSKLTEKVHFGKEAVRKFLSLSWLMFVLALGFAIISQIKLQRSREYGSGLRWLEITLNGLILSAFMFLSLSVSAYVPEVGFVGVGFISFFALVLIIMWLKGRQED
jgi:hypothetical protein